MRWVSIGILIFTSSLVAEDLPLDRSDFVASPHFTGERIPTPPQQSAEWKSIPTPEHPDFAPAAENAFVFGLADPRGCTYRSAKIATGNCWTGDSGVVETNVWVFPASQKGDKSTPFAVAWNGLVYPLVSLGEKADLGADVESLFADENQSRRFWISRSDNENTSVQPNSSLISAALLLRLGNAEAAKRILHSLETEKRGRPEESAIAILDDWLWNLYNRAVCAHMRGDDGLSHASMALFEEKIGPIRSYIDSLLSEERRHPDYHPFGWMREWKILQAESKRRLQPLDERPPAGSLAREILELENVNSRQWSQPGGVHIASDRRVHALVERGEEAIDALLECLEHDTRLTRAVSFHRDFGKHRQLISVREAAHAALTEILQVSEFEGTGDPHPIYTAEGRTVMAKAIRKYWEKNRSLTKPERWFAALQNDDPDPAIWREAAEMLTSPPVRYSDTGFGVLQLSRSKEDTTPPAGEPLRERKGPSVGELLLRRTLELDEAKKHWDTVSLANSLARWDALTYREELSALIQRFHSYIESDSLNHPRGILSSIKTLTETRHQAGDPTAIGDYARLMRIQTPRTFDFLDESLFELLAEFSHVSSVKETITALFGPDGPWFPLVDRESNNSRMETISLWPQLIKVPAFKDNLLRCLTDTARIGLITITANGIQLSGEFFGTRNSSVAEGTTLPPEGTTYVLRVCDLTAYFMDKGLRENSLTFEIYQPATIRGEQIAVIVDWIKEG